MSRKCIQCGSAEKMIGKRSDAKYCCEACRKAYERATGKIGKNRRAGKGQLSGLADVKIIEKPVEVKQPKLIEKTIKIDTQPTVEPELTFEMMPPLRGYVEDPLKRRLPPAPEPPEPFTEERPEEILPQKRTFTVSKPNPRYKELFAAKEHQEKAITDKRAHIGQLEKQLTQIEQSEEHT